MTTNVRSEETNETSIRDLRQKQVVQDVIDSNYHGLVNAVMRYGKTHIGIGTISALNDSLPEDERETFKVLWVTPDAQLRDFKIKEDFISVGKEELYNHVRPVTWALLAKIRGKYDLIILDEYQFITPNNSKLLLKGELSAPRIVGLTGTPPKAYEKVRILSKLKLNEISTINLEEGIQDKVLSDYRVTVIKFDLEKSDLRIKWKDNKISERTAYEYYTNNIERLRAEYRDFGKLSRLRMALLYGSTKRLEVMQKLKSLLESKSKRGLLFAAYQYQVEKLGPHYHSKSATVHYNKFQDKKINYLGLVKTGGVGRDYHDIEFVVIGQPTKDYTGITTQNWGRGLLYKEGTILDIYILCSNHTVEESVWLPECLSGIDPEKITYTTIEELCK